MLIIPGLNVISITRLLLDAMNIGRANNPGIISQLPDSEFLSAIVEACIPFVEHVPPSKVKWLFQPGNVPSLGECNCGTWTYILNKATSYFLEQCPAKAFMFNNVPCLEFEKKMCNIMNATLQDVPSHQEWTKCEMGYILAFWITKLYKVSYRFKSK